MEDKIDKILEELEYVNALSADTNMKMEALRNWVARTEIEVAAMSSKLGEVAAER